MHVRMCEVTAAHALLSVVPRALSHPVFRLRAEKKQKKQQKKAKEMEQRKSLVSQPIENRSCAPHG